MNDNHLRTVVNDNHLRTLEEIVAEAKTGMKPTHTLPDDDDYDLSVGGAAKKPRKPRRRKEVTADKFIVVRVTKELYDKVQFASDLAGVNTSKWVRQAVQEQLSK